MTRSRTSTITRTFDYADLLQGTGAPHALDVPLAPRTWYKTGGPAAVLAHPQTPGQLAGVVKRCREAGVPLYTLGSGANLLVRDAGVDGVVVRLDAPAWRAIYLEGTRVIAGAGVDLFTLVNATARAGLDGLAHVAGIPASVGGAIRMNAGGAYGDIGQAVTRVRVMGRDGEVYDRTADDLAFTYRRVNIAAPFILEAEFALDTDDPAALLKRVKEIFLHKKNSQPLGEKSAGCCFKNPPPEVSELAAGQLIDRAGLKGHAVGGASVSGVHANFFVAAPGTPAADIIALMEHVQHVVADRFGVTLEREVVVW